MHGLIGDQVCYAEPAFIRGGEFRVQHGVNGAGEGRVYVYPPDDAQLLEFGVTFYVMDGKANLNPRTGKFKLLTPKAVIRAVFAGQHRDVEVTR